MYSTDQKEACQMIKEFLLSAGTLDAMDMCLIAVISASADCVESLIT